MVITKSNAMTSMHTMGMFQHDLVMIEGFSKHVNDVEVTWLYTTSYLA